MKNINMKNTVNQQKQHKESQRQCNKNRNTSVITILPINDNKIQPNYSTASHHQNVPVNSNNINKNHSKHDKQRTVIKYNLHHKFGKKNIQQQHHNKTLQEHIHTHFNSQNQQINNEGQKMRKSKSKSKRKNVGNAGNENRNECGRAQMAARCPEQKIKDKIIDKQKEIYKLERKQQQEQKQKYAVKYKSRSNDKDKQRQNRMFFSNTNYANSAKRLNNNDDSKNAIIKNIDNQYCTQIKLISNTNINTEIGLANKGNIQQKLSSLQQWANHKHNEQSKNQCTPQHFYYNNYNIKQHEHDFHTTAGTVMLPMNDMQREINYHTNQRIKCDDLVNKNRSGSASNLNVGENQRFCISSSIRNTNKIYNAQQQHNEHHCLNMQNINKQNVIPKPSNKNQNSLHFLHSHPLTYNHSQLHTSPPVNNHLFYTSFNSSSLIPTNHTTPQSKPAPSLTYATTSLPIIIPVSYPHSMHAHIHPYTGIHTNSPNNTPATTSVSSLLKLRQSQELEILNIKHEQQLKQLAFRLENMEEDNNILIGRMQILQIQLNLSNKKVHQMSIKEQKYIISQKKLKQKILELENKLATLNEQINKNNSVQLQAHLNDSSNQLHFNQSGNNFYTHNSHHTYNSSDREIINRKNEEISRLNEIINKTRQKVNELNEEIGEQRLVYVQYIRKLESDIKVNIGDGTIKGRVNVEVPNKQEELGKNCSKQKIKIQSHYQINDNANDSSRLKKVFSANFLHPQISSDQNCAFPQKIATVNKIK